MEQLSARRRAFAEGGRRGKVVLSDGGARVLCRARSTQPPRITSCILSHAGAPTSVIIDHAISLASCAVVAARLAQLLLAPRPLRLVDFVQFLCVRPVPRVQFAEVCTGSDRVSRRRS